MPPKHERLFEVIRLFLKLGTTAFGGPAAHVGMMEHEIVTRRKWLTHAEFLDLLGAANLIPGPNSTEMAIYIGHRRAGWPGLLAAGICFIVPAMVIVTVLAWAYVSLGSLPGAHAVTNAVFAGIKPVIMAIIVLALWRLAKTAVKTKFLAVVAVAAAALNFAGVNELVVLFGTGLFMMSARLAKRKPHLFFIPLFGISPGITLGAAATSAAAPFSMGALFLFFLKVGAVLFGTGYVLLAFLQADLVERWHWLTENQLLDAIAVGQFTPGPLFTTATFIGYLLGGPDTGSRILTGVLATVGIFLPAFIFVAISGPILPRLRASPWTAAALDGVNVASLALMGVVTWNLGRASLVNWVSALLFAVAGWLLLRYKVNSVWLVLGGALVGFLVYWMPSM
jgi:chromate transporter